MEKEKKPHESESGGGGGLGSPFDEKPPGGVTVSVGPYVENLPIAGRSVGEVRKRFKTRMDIDDRSQAIADGTEVGADYVLKEGQTLIFIHKSGEKGAVKKAVEAVLTSAGVPINERYQLLKGVMMDDNTENAQKVLSLLANKTTADAAKAKAIADMLAELERGPMRVATFLEMLPGSTTQARVIMDDGTQAYTVLPVNQAVTIKCGDEVLLDKNANAILHSMGVRPDAGEEALYERVIGDKHVEISMREEKFVFNVAEELDGQIKAGQVKPGDTLVVNHKKQLAYRHIPAADSLAHYRYLVRERVPDISVERDIGSPSPCIQDTLDHIQLELTQPGISREYGIRRTLTRLMAGVSGSGKTISIQAIIAEAYRMLSEMTKTPVHELPPRVFRLRMSEVLNCYLGESDKNLARFFREVEQMANESFVNSKGRQFELPVFAVIEEVDGLARSRGQDDNNGIYDRILTTALQWLDSTRQELQEKLIVYLGTTNEPDTIDRAFLRRIGGTVDRFNRLDQQGFAQVLDKHLSKMPLVDDRMQMVGQLTEWVFSHPSSVELKLSTGITAVRKRQHMLTGALVDRAVQDAAKVARKEHARNKQKGITMQMVMDGFNGQFVAMIDQLNEQNARHYVDLPEGARVQGVKRVSEKQQPTVTATDK